MGELLKERPVKSELVNQDLIIVYVLPYIVYVAIGVVLDPWLGSAFVYIIRLVLVSGLLLWPFRWYVTITGPKHPMVSGLYGFVFGLIGLFVWCVLCMPFVEPEVSKSWSKSAFILRFISAGFLVPVFEELLMRGLVFRVAFQWYQRFVQGQSQAFYHALEKDNIAYVTPGAWSIPAMFISSLIFAFGHGMEQWLAAFVYGLLMVWLWVIRKDLISCMVAHGVTNMGLALYVLYSGRWYLW